MPIAQERLINLIASGEAMLDAIDEQKKFIRQFDIPMKLSEGNAALEHINDGPTKDVVSDLLVTLSQLYYLFNDFDIPLNVRMNIYEEKAHFKIARKTNERMAHYKRYRTAAKKSMAESVARIPRFFDFSDEAPSPPQASAMASPKPEFIQPQLLPATSPPKLSAEDKAYLAGKIDKETYDRLKKPAAIATHRGASYDKDVVSTSVPSLEELNSIGTVKPGEDVF